MRSYIQIMRLDHWIKQLFIIPGIITGVLLIENGDINFSTLSCIIGFFAVSLIASANYVINEYLDAEFDKFHPTKKNRAAVINVLNGRVVFSEYLGLAIVGMLLSLAVGSMFTLSNLVLLLMGVLYNVKPFRLKDVQYFDVLIESVNNMLRFLLGWFIITESAFPPVSIVFGYWMGGSFLMAMKRFAEYRMIGDKAIAATYRKSFAGYTEVSLLVSSFFYAMCSTFFIGIFLVKYKIELILFIPFVFVFFCYYVVLSFRTDSAAQKPEKLYKDKFLMAYSLFLFVIFFILLNCNIGFLEIFQNNSLIRI